MPPVRAALAPGELLEGKYEIRRELGRGAMGIVYEALHVALGRRVAVKTMIEGGNADVELGARFEREARAASAIGHPHIVDVFDLGRTPDGLLFMVMELLDGRPLSELLRQTPMLPLPLALDLMGQVLSGLGAAHKNGIVHRDLKPENVFIVASEDRPNFVKLVDFGISKVLGPKSPAPPGTAKFAGTMVGAVLGTPLYMSPEQAIGQVAVIDHRTDIYSAGVLLYEMLCGRTPFTGRTYPEVLGQILEGRYRPPSELRPDIPRTVEAAIARALARDIETRFPSAAAMRAALTAATAELTLAPLPGPAEAPHFPPLQAPSGGDSVGRQAPSDARRSSDGRPGLPADPFGPPPEAETPPLLDTRDRAPGRRPAASQGPAAEPQVPVPPRPVARPRVPTADVPAPGQATLAGGEAAPSETETEPAGAPKQAKRPWVLWSAGAVVLAVALRLAYGAFGPDGKRPPGPGRPAHLSVALVVEPKEASVQIDHVPVAAGVLPLDTTQGRPHILNAAAPGRITRRFTFTAQSGKTLTVRLGRALDLPSTSDPPPLPAELAADHADSPRPAEEIDRAFGQLERYTTCVAPEGGDDGKKGRVLIREESLAPCRVAVAEATQTEHAFPELQTAAQSYLAVAQRAQRPEQLARAAAAVRAELLAARATWQHEELSRQGKDEGQTASWHMRRVALAAQAWLRARAGGASAAAAIEDKRGRLDQAFASFMGMVSSTPHVFAHTTGGTDFVAAADALVALANGVGARKVTDFAALEAARRVIASFNALVVE